MSYIPPAYTPQPQPSKSTVPPWLVAILACAVVGVFLVVLGACVAIVGGEEDEATPETTTTEAPEATTTTERQTTTTTERQTTTTAEATTTTERETTTTQRPTTTTIVSEADLVEEWYDENGWIVDEISANLESIATAGDATDVVAMNGACQSLASTISIAQRADPIPVLSIDIPWQRGLSDFATAADLCLAFDYDGAADHLVTASDHISEATSAVEALI